MSGDAPLVAVVDYGIGNLHSAHKALRRMGADARLTADPGLIAAAAGVVLPGVGAFAACMGALRRAGLEEPVRAAAGSGRPFLGICVGMQMLFSSSDEIDVTGRAAEGLGIIPGTVRWLPAGVKRPQMQWNLLEVARPGDPMLAGLERDAWVYFVHSLHG
ncbi:MAG: imidazole glycerol phosphate synthase subunit HisH, partial [Ilumatobacteraceae bacterium]